MILILKGKNREKRFEMDSVKDGVITTTTGEEFTPTNIEFGEEELELIKNDRLLETHDLVKQYAGRYILHKKGYKTTASAKTWRDYKVKFSEADYETI